MKNEEFYTFKEIMRQPDVWQSIYNGLNNSNAPGYEIFKGDFDEIIFFGCGSSYNISQSAAFFVRSLSKSISSLAVPSSELMTNTDLYFRDGKKYLAIGFSRSGETSESVEVAKILKAKKNVDLFAFSCKKDSSLCKLADDEYTCSDAVEKSIVMTISFSSLLLACCAIFAKISGNLQILKDMENLIVFIKKNLLSIDSFVKSYVDDNDFRSFFALGSGFNYGLAVEADLKMKEMSQVPSYSYHIYEFSHGPKSLLTDASLCLVLTPGDNLINYEKLLEQYSELRTKMVIIGSRTINAIKNDRTQYLLQTDSFKNDVIKSFISIPVFQLMAFYKTLKNSLNPDLPKNLSYTVKI